MKEQIEISVVILNWNGFDFLDKCLTSIQSQSFKGFETILVDNGSTDESVEYVRENFPWVRILELSENVGFCVGNNRGYEIAIGRAIFFLNNDTELAPNALERLVHAIRYAPDEIGFWATKMIQLYHPDLIDNCGIGLSSFGAGYQRFSGKPKDRFGNENELIFGASGGAGCFKRSVLEEIGGFEDLYFFNNEDVDLSFRAQLAGYQCQFVHDVIVYHVGSASGIKNSDFTTYQIHKNKELVYFINMPNPLLLKYLPSHLLHGLLWTVYWFLNGKGLLVLRAKLEAWSLRRQIRDRRKNVKRLTQKDSAYIQGYIKRKPILGVISRHLEISS